MGFTGECPIPMCFFSLELDLMEKFYPKTIFRQTLSVQKNTEKENTGDHRGNNREKYILMQRFRSFFFVKFEFPWF